MKVVWAESAARRLADLETYLREQAGEARAAEIVLAIIELGESLESLPDRGRRLPEAPRSEYRELVERDTYRLVYRRRDDLVEIVTVFERHRNLPEEIPPAPPAPTKRKPRSRRRLVR